MTQEAIKMGMTAEDLALIEKVYRENPSDPKTRADYLEAGIREVRSKLHEEANDILSVGDELINDYKLGLARGFRYAVKLLDEILPASDEEMGVPILTRDGKEDEK